MTAPLPDLNVDFEPQAWYANALCRAEKIDPRLFFPAAGDNRRIKEVKEICARCPVKEECRAFALRFVSTMGIWGGTTERERRRLRCSRD